MTQSSSGAKQDAGTNVRERANTMSLMSRGARHQIGVAIALITIIPLLVLLYMTIDPGLHDAQTVWPRVLIVALACASIALGYIMLCTYPLNIVRLRRYLEEIVNGQAPEKVCLLQGMNDVRAIERSLNLLVEQFKDQLRRLEDEIENRKRAESLKDDFISTVSHELRTPLAISKEGISLVLDGIAGDLNEKQVKLLSTSERNVDRLARIINDLLDISKIEAGMLDVDRKQTRLGDLLEQTVAAMQPLAKKKGLAIELDVAPQPVEVYVDPDRMVQVIGNLVSNAIKFTDEGGVFLDCRTREGKAVCCVRDTGRGMSDADVPHVFEKFRQFGRTHGAGDRGTGLGLAIVRNIVELHGGTIDVSSTLGSGSTFTFQLPLYTPEKALLENIDYRLRTASQTDEVFTLVLLNLLPRTPVDAVEWEKMFQAFYRCFAEQASVMRDSDLMMSRLDHQLVFIGEMRSDCREMVAKRWSNLVRQSFAELYPEVEMCVRHAIAAHPDDGQDADALLKVAENRVVVLSRQEAALQKGAGTDA